MIIISAWKRSLERLLSIEIQFLDNSFETGLGGFSFHLFDIA